MKEIIYFIKSIKDQINSIVTPDKPLILNFVIGDVTCDMDSFLSSIVLSYFRNINSGAITINSNELTYNVYNLGNRIYIPVINCRKGELCWRLDIKELMSSCGLNENDFFYFSDVLSITSLGQLVFHPVELNSEKLECKF